MQAEMLKGRRAEAIAREAKIRLVSLCVCVFVSKSEILKPLLPSLLGNRLYLDRLSPITLSARTHARTHTHTHTHTHTLHVGATAREALLTSRSKVRVLERFASLNLMAVVKIVKKHDKLVRKFAPGVGKALSSQVVASSCKQA